MHNAHYFSRRIILTPLISRVLKALEDRFHCSKRRTKLLLEKGAQKAVLLCVRGSFFSFFFFFSSLSRACAGISRGRGACSLKLLENK
jgi:hypothetical protein